MSTPPHDPSKPVSSKEELAQLLRAGLDSGEPEPLTPEDWEALRRRAAAGTDTRESS